MESTYSVSSLVVGLVIVKSAGLHWPPNSFGNAKVEGRLEFGMPQECSITRLAARGKRGGARGRQNRARGVVFGNAVADKVETDFCLASPVGSPSAAQRGGGHP